MNSTFLRIIFSESDLPINLLNPDQWDSRKPSHIEDTLEKIESFSIEDNIRKSQKQKETLHIWLILFSIALAIIANLLPLFRIVQWCPFWKDQLIFDCLILLPCFSLGQQLTNLKETKNKEYQNLKHIPYLLAIKSQEAFEHFLCDLKKENEQSDHFTSEVIYGMSLKGNIKNKEFKLKDDYNNALIMKNSLTLPAFLSSITIIASIILQLSNLFDLMHQAQYQPSTIILSISSIILYSVAILLCGFVYQKLRYEKATTILRFCFLYSGYVQDNTVQWLKMKTTLSESEKEEYKERLRARIADEKALFYSEFKIIENDNITTFFTSNKNIFSETQRIDSKKRI